MFLPQQSEKTLDVAVAMAQDIYIHLWTRIELLMVVQKVKLQRVVKSGL